MTPLIKTKPRCGAYGSLDNRCHIRPSLTKQNRSGSMPSVDWLGEHRTGGSAAPEYSRGDKSLFRMILERVGVVEIVKEDNEDDIAFSDNKLIENFYDSWAELDNEVKSKIALPGYIPDRYSLYGIKYWDFNNRKNIQADYYNEENKHILIEITLLESDAKQYREMRMDEDIYLLLSEYCNEDTLYYQYEDEYICMIFMGNIFYRISGNISLEEMIKIREGLENIK